MDSVIDSTTSTAISIHEAFLQQGSEMIMYKSKAISAINDVDVDEDMVVYSIALLLMTSSSIMYLYIPIFCVFVTIRDYRD